MIDHNRIAEYFRKEFWHCINNARILEVWEHMDDPSIGKYFVHLSPNGVESIDYKHPLSSMFDSHFDTIGSWAKHVSEITNDPIDDEKMAPGTAKLHDIANQLRKNRYQE